MLQLSIFHNKYFKSLIILWVKDEKYWQIKKLLYVICVLLYISFDFFGDWSVGRIDFFYTHFERFSFVVFIYFFFFIKCDRGGYPTLYFSCLWFFFFPIERRSYRHNRVNRVFSFLHWNSIRTLQDFSIVSIIVKKISFEICQIVKNDGLKK